MSRLDTSPIPDEVLEAIHYEVERAGLEYADNYRAYRLRDDFLRTHFRKREARGCCGFFKTTYRDTHGDKWVIACNYGH